MILASEKTTKDIRQSEPDPQFTVRAPRVNPLAAGSTFAVTKGAHGIGLDSLDELQPQTEIESRTLSSRMIARCKREIERRPNSARAHTNLGIALLNAGQLASAKSEFETALRIDPTHYVAATSLGRIEVETGYFDRAVRIYEDLRRYYPKNATPLVSLAHMAMKRQDWINAERLLRDAINMGHRALTARYNLAMIQLKLGKSREAIALLRSAARDEVRAPSIYEGLGAAYALNGDFHRAAVAFKTALSLDPSSHSAVHGLAKVLLQLKLIDEVIELIVDYLERVPADHDARQLLARAYGERGQYRSAVAQLTHVFTEIEASESKDVTLKARLANNIGASFLKDGDKTQARYWLMKSLDLAPDYEPIPYQNLARVYIQTREFSEALVMLERCRKRFPDDQNTVLLTSNCLTRCGLYDQAIAQFEPFIASGKAVPALYADLGRILSDAKGDYGSALDVLRQGYERSKRDFGVVNNLAYVYLMLGDAKAARLILESFEPTNDSHKEGSTSVVLTATWGLLHIVEGDLELGQQFYKEAQKLASTAGNKELARTVAQKMHLELARAFYRAGNSAATRKHVQQGLAISDGSDFYNRDLQVLDRKCRSLSE
jgi:tetratricopeptide (TPR) repeat protein